MAYTRVLTQEGSTTAAHCCMAQAEMLHQLLTGCDVTLLVSAMTAVDWNLPAARASTALQRHTNMAFH